MTPIVSTASRAPTVLTHDGLLVVEIAGDPYERGRQHGVALGERIRHLRARLIGDIVFGKGPAMGAAFLTVLYGILLRMHPNIPRELRDEMRGVADGARVPYRELEFLLKYGHSEAFTIPDAVRAGVYPEEFLVGPDEFVRVVPGPETIHIVVCGDPHRNRAMVLWGGYVNPVTRKIELHAD